MAAQMCRSMMLQQRLIASLALQYEAKVLDAWGNHIPRSVRESATSIFFLPILLWKKKLLVEQMPYNWLRSLFQLRKCLDCLHCITRAAASLSPQTRLPLRYVSTQVKIFDWEAVDDLSDKDGVPWFSNTLRNMIDSSPCERERESELVSMSELCPMPNLFGLFNLETSGFLGKQGPRPRHSVRHVAAKMEENLANPGGQRPLSCA